VFGYSKNKFLKHSFLKNKIYGKIYFPYYGENDHIYQKVPELYNKDGVKQDFFFLRDNYFPFNPYGNSNYFLFDRFNIQLNTHFYTHESMLETIGDPDRRYGLFVESESIVPKSYLIFKKHKNLNREFTKIFTFSDDILSTIPNSQFFASCANITYDTSAVIDKCKNISIVSSNKTMCDLHRYRIDLANMCKNEGLADTFGTFDNQSTEYVSINRSLDNYRFSFAIENDIKPFFFTEKLTNCLISKTIPIYCGATEVGKFFNEDGIIRITPESDIKTILKQCTEEFYKERLDAVLDNYNRAKKYLNIWDSLYLEHLKSN